MKRICLLLTVIASVVFSAMLCYGADKIGYIDMQRALNNSEAGVESKATLQDKLKKYQAELNLKQEELQRLKAELEKQGVVLDASARAAKEKDYQQKLKDFQRSAKDAEEDLQARDADYTKKIVEALDKVVQEYGKKNGYTAIFDLRGAGMIYADKQSDITEEILKVFNASRVKAEVKK